jgi:hypothetical protein
VPTGVKHVVASTSTPVILQGASHISSATVVVATTSFSAPSVPVVELSTTCSTLGAHLPALELLKQHVLRHTVATRRKGRR